MGSRKGKRLRHSTPNRATDETIDDSWIIFQALLSAIESPQGVNPSVLKRLYLVLNCLSSQAICRSSYGVDSNLLNMEIGNDWIKVTIKDILRLSDVLFKELSGRFEQFFSALCNAGSSKNPGDDMSILDLCGAAEIVNLLLRCCLVMLNLVQYQQNVLLVKGQVLLVILQKLSSVNFNARKEKKGIRYETSISHACRNGHNDCATSFTEDFVASLHFVEPSDSRFRFVPGMLEVILDELLVHGQLRSIFKLIYSVAPTCEKYISRWDQGNIGLLMEVISTHFSLAFSDKQGIEDFLNGLFQVQKKEFRDSLRAEVSPSAASLLLLNPIILSAPKYLQAHVIALVSEAISNVQDCENCKPDCRLINCFLTILEKSVTLYANNMCNLQLDSSCTSGKDSVRSNISGEKFQPSFECVVLPDTRMKINHLITKLDDFSESDKRSMSYETKSDFVSSAIKYAKECQHVLDKSCGDEILSILSCIILRASDGFNNAASQAVGVVCLQDLCILASILKLMSTSLLKVIWCLRYSGDLNHPKSLRDFSSCKEYDFVLSIISYFGEFSSHLSRQQLSGNMTQTNSTGHKISEMMFLHFSGLLSLTFTIGLDFLMKGCLLTIMGLMNLSVFEEGNLDALRLLLDSSSETLSSDSPLVSIQEIVMGQKSSLVVASKFQRFRTLSLSSSSLENHYTELGRGLLDTIQGPSIHTKNVALGIEEETEETSNGEVFLQCLLKNNEKASDFDDLVDFIECKQGKDYSSWLKNREKYRKWKGEKMAVLRWRRKKKTWRVAKGKKI